MKLGAKSPFNISISLLTRVKELNISFKGAEKAIKAWSLQR